LTHSNEVKTGYIQVSGADVFYQQSGSQHDAALVMIHAGICDSRMWQAQIAHFSARFHVIAFDLYGFGQSGTPTETFTLHDDVITILDYFGIAQAWLMAASLGGTVALEVALMHPQRIQGLLLAAPAVRGYTFTGDAHPLTEAIIAADDAGDLARISELEVQMWVDGRGRTPDDMDKDMRALVVEMNLIALQADEDFWENEIEPAPPVLKRLQEIKKPTLLIYGDLDIAPSLERLDIIAEKIDYAEKVLIAGTAHLPNMEQAAIFNRIVDNFLRAQGA